MKQVLPTIMDEEIIAAKPMCPLLRIILFATAIIVVSVLVWQGISSAGAPDPTIPRTSSTVAVLDIAVLVSREGLECVLVLSAIMASMIGERQSHRRPVVAGAGIAFLATLITWFIAISVVNNLSRNISALNLQAATGLLAVVVLLVVMNWFFHKLYWGGWISMHTRKKTELLQNANDAEISDTRLLWGLGLVGFTSF